MKMLLVTLDFPPLRGGVAGYYAGLLGALPSDSVAVLADPATDDERFDATLAYPVFRSRILGRFRPRWKHAWLRVLAVRRRFRFDILLVGQILPLGYAALAIRALFGIPYAVFVHGLDLLSAGRSPWKRFWAKSILRGASLVIANSQWTKSLAQKFGVAEGRVEVVYPCPGARTFTESSKCSFVGRWNLAGKRVILSVGRLVSRKGHDLMIEAMPDVLRAHPDAVYVVVGDGPERERLRHLASKMALADRLVFTGEIDDKELSAAYSTADVFVLPAREERDDAEGFGLVFLEAATVGLPVVAGRGGGVAEAVIDGVTGILVDPRDPIAIATAVNHLLSDKDLARRMGEAGRKRVINDFQWSRQVENLRSVISQAIDCRL